MQKLTQQQKLIAQEYVEALLEKASEGSYSLHQGLAEELKDDEAACEIIARVEKALTELFS